MTGTMQEAEQVWGELEAAASEGGWSLSISADDTEVGFGARPAGQSPPLRVSATRPGSEPIVEVGASVAAVAGRLVERLRAG